MLSGTKAHNSSGTLISGSMTNVGKQEIKLTGTSATTITKGYHDGTGSAVIDTANITNLTSANIKDGVTILGVPGSYTGGGGSLTVATGTASLTTSSSTTSIKITDTSTIGFTPKAFFLWCNTAQTSRYYVSVSTFMQHGTSSSYVRHTKYRGSNADSYLNATTSWTTQTSGYLYFASNTFYFRNSSSYRVSAIFTISSFIGKQEYD